VDAAELTLSVLPFVRALARRLPIGGTCGLSREDLVQEGALALLERGSRYDPARGKPTTFAGIVARRYMLRLIARERLEAHPCRLFDSISEDFRAALGRGRYAGWRMRYGRLGGEAS